MKNNYLMHPSQDLGILILPCIQKGWVLLQGFPHRPPALCGVSPGFPEGQQLHQPMGATPLRSCPDVTSDTFHTSLGISLQEVGSGPLPPTPQGLLIV